MAHARKQNIINHIGVVLDASSSMTGIARKLIEVTDAQIRHLAQRSKEMDQETRISVWTFSYSNRIECLIWDMDVLRVPSIADLYRAEGQTAIIDATLQAIRDLRETSERYGDHSFLIYVFTDGQENDSRNLVSTLQDTIKTLPDHWTLAALVPNATAKHEAKRFGFPAGNVEIWDATSNVGVEEGMSRARASTDAYMKARADGVRSTKNLFSTDAAAVNKATISQARLTPLPKGSYLLVPVPRDCAIKEFTESCGYTYRAGRGYYQLTKTEDIQANKEIVVVERRTAKVYSGPDARQLIGLPDMNVRVKPDFNPDFDIFVQSTSVNRKLIAGTKYLLMLS